MSTNPQPIPHPLQEGFALSEGYRSLTTGYKIPSEEWMLLNVIADMRRGGIDHVIVESNCGPEVWRRNFKKGEPVA